MKTLKIESGDLVLGQGGFAAVSGAAKVKQDLAVAMLEPLGCDRFHPRWGSTLATFVGEVDNDLSRARIVSEVTRLIRNYIAVQGTQVRSDLLGYRKARYTTNDLVQDIDGIDMRQEFDRLYVRVKVRTASGESVVLSNMTRA